MGNMREILSDLYDLKNECDKYRKALQKIADKKNWGYLDSSGCSKGHGQYSDSWIAESHPIDIANDSLADES